MSGFTDNERRAEAVRRLAGAGEQGWEISARPNIPAGG